MNATTHPFDADLSDLSALDDDEIPLAEAALRIAMLEYPRLDVARWLGEIDSLARRALGRAASSGPADLLEALDATLFDEAGFHGNSLNYYDPRNSFLNDVLERRVGIPISLSMVYIEVGVRMGLDLRGIGFPGHFLVGHFGGDDLELIDPFNRGARLTRADCAQMLATRGETVELEPSHLASATNRQILVRMLTNLKVIYMQQEDTDRAVRVIDRILQISPGSITELRDRGLALLKGGRPSRALEDLREYAEQAPHGEDAKLVRGAIGNALRELARYN